MTSPTNPTIDLVNLLRMFSDAEQVGSLIEEAANEIDNLREALRPFANAHHQATSFMSRCSDNHNATEARDLYMWWAPRTLSVSNFKAAAIALGEKT